MPDARSGILLHPPGKNSGFSLHAGVATKAQEREKLEKICRYIARPAFSEERLSTNLRGEIIYRLKQTHLRRGPATTKKATQSSQTESHGPTS
ncbi:MAG: transposase [Bdellovibrionaceae bacterium]|nr:transposase [Pseudobdellovibrionaceae bacterium]